MQGKLVTIATKDGRSLHGQLFTVGPEGIYISDGNQEKVLRDAVVSLHWEAPFKNRTQKLGNMLARAYRHSGKLLGTPMGPFALWRNFPRSPRGALPPRLSACWATYSPAIRMFAETLALGRVTDAASQQKYLETIARESRRLARLVDDYIGVLQARSRGVALFHGANGFGDDH